MMYPFDRALCRRCIRRRHRHCDRPARSAAAGDYLAIATLGFGEIIRVVILNIPKSAVLVVFRYQPGNFFGHTYLFMILTVLIIKTSFQAITAALA